VVGAVVDELLDAAHLVRALRAPSARVAACGRAASLHERPTRDGPHGLLGALSAIARAVAIPISREARHPPRAARPTAVILHERQTLDGKPGVLCALDTVGVTVAFRPGRREARETHPDSGAEHARRPHMGGAAGGAAAARIKFLELCRAPL
jgi:hypothetical protein